MMKVNKEREILKSLRKGEKTASEISIYAQANYYVIKQLLSKLIDEGKIEMFEFRRKKYYKLKKGEKHEI